MKLLAGGQSLMPMLNLRLARPQYISDLHASAEFRRHLSIVLTQRALRQAAARAQPS